jgi:ribonuclease P protein component
VTEFDFSKKSRIALKKDFTKVLEEGSKISDNNFAVWWKVADSEKTISRLGLIVSKKVGKAVVRNRIKRLIREVFRLNKGDFIKPIDLIVYPKTSQDLKDFDNVKKALFNIWKSAKLVK